MSRLASAVKGGFYPLPPIVMELILTHLVAPQGGRILDPCAGEGEALATLAKGLGLEAYGIELHQERAAAATERLSMLAGRDLPLADPHERHLVAGDYRLARVARHGVNLLYINPPYDSDHEDGRLEYQWLRDTREWLQPDGVLVLVVPQHVLGYGMVARYLASWYREVAVWRFPADEYERFGQVVLFGVRAAHAGAPEEEALARYREIAGAGEALAVLPTLSVPAYTLPPVRVSPAQFTFQAAWVEPEDALAEAGRVGVRQHATWRGHLAPRAADHRPVRPLMPLKVGHLAGLLAAGFLDHQRLADGEEELLVRGRAYKRARYQAREEELPDGRVQRVQTMTEQVVVDVTTLAPDGAVQSLTGAKLEAFMARWLEPLTSHVARRYPPQYPFQLGRYAGCLATLSQARRIPRTDRYGLMPAQQHAAAACATRLARHKDAILVGECGSGKAQPLDARVLTPTGWRRMGELQVGDEVINPEGGTARIVGVFPQGQKPIFRVTFSDDSTTECCDDHLWQVFTPERRWRRMSPQVVALRDIRERLRGRRGNCRYFVPLVAPVEYPARVLPLDPYLLGVLLGDGGLSQTSIMLSTADLEILAAVIAALPEGVTATYVSGYDYRLRSDRGAPNLLCQHLRELDLVGRRSHDKFIPEEYLHASVADRIALLQGLLDTDGWVSGTSIEFTSSSEPLARGVQAIVQSLGGTARLRTKATTYTYKGERRQGRLAYRMAIVLPAEVQPFRLSRKASAYRPWSRYGPCRTITSVEPRGTKPAQCIALDSANQLYVTDDYIVTHNTTVGVAVAALLDAPRTVVLCPPHLVEKWQREAKIVWPALEVSALTTISDVARFFAPYEGPRLGVLSHSKAKLASGWRAAYDTWLPTKEQLLARYAPHLVGTASPEEVEAYYTGELAPRLLKYARWRGVRCPDCGARVVGSDGLPLAAWQIEKRRSRLHCRACGGVLFQFDRQRSAKQSPTSFRDHVQREAELRAWRAAHPEPDAVPPTYPAPAGYARWPLARYLREHHAGALSLLLADEMHQFAGMDSDQGYAFADLSVAARRVLGLTGTIYGGKASSLFHLLYRLSPEMCRAFTEAEETGQRRLRHKPWVERYGVLQEIETTPVREADGKLTANPRSTVRVQELPGASPAMLPWLLDRAVFLSLADMGFALPDYAEIPLEVELSEPMRERYDALWKALHDELAERLVRGDKSLLGAYLQSLLNWVDSPWRAEVVLDPYDKREGRKDPRVIARIAGLPAEQLFPKEEAVLDLVREERARGRRCVLYVHQTATRDITPRWVALFQAAGLKAAVLKCAPTEREAWLAQQVAADVDVVITHPRRVETGLDLLPFPTLIWLAPDYSVYTTLQASRRAWRIGQEEPCKVYFLCYSGTLQADALRLIAAKVAATLRVSGEIVATESLAELDELAASDMVSALAKLVVERGTGEVESLEEAFAAASADLRASQAVVGGYQMAEPEEAILDGVILAEVEADAPVRAALPAPLAGAAPPPLVAPPLPVLPGARPRAAQPSLLEVTTPVSASPPGAEEVPAAVGTEPEAADEPEGKPPFPVLPLVFPEVGVPTLARHKVGAGSLWEALQAERKVA